MKNTEDYKGKWSSSWHGDYVTTTPKKLMDLADKLEAEYYCGNDGDDKTNFDFEFLTSEGIYFTVYDWKEYRKLNVNEAVDFHVGADNPIDSRKALLELEREL